MKEKEAKEVIAKAEENQELNLPAEGDEGEPMVPAVAPKEKTKKQLKLEKKAEKKARESHKAELEVLVEANPDDQEAAAELAKMKSEDQKAFGLAALKIGGGFVAGATAVYTVYKIVTGKGKDSDESVADANFTEVPNDGTPEE